MEYRKLNEMTESETFRLSNIEECVENVAADNFIALLDLQKGYWQIHMFPREQRVAAFVTNFGCFFANIDTVWVFRG